MANAIRKKLDAHAAIGNHEIEARVDDLNSIYAAARDRLEGRIHSYVRQSRTSFTGPRLVLLMEELKKEFAVFETAYGEKFGYALNWVAQGYYRDAMYAIGLHDGNKSVTGGISKERLKLMTDDAYSHIAGATRQMQDYAIYQLRKTSARVMREAALTGETRVQVARRLLLENTRGGNFQFIAKNGARWSNEAYFDMLSRTMLHNNAREAYMQSCADRGCDIVRVSVSGTPCPKCAAWENRLLSIAGKTPGLPTVEAAMSGGLMHPNCTHRLIAVPAVIAKKRYTADGRPASGLNSPGGTIAG